MELKAIVKQVNEENGNSEFELWFPSMFRDGSWSCTIVGSSVISDFTFKRFYQVIERENLLFFFGSMNGDVSIHIQ